MPQTKSERIGIRLSPVTYRTLALAAAVADKTLSEFIREASLTAASRTLNRSSRRDENPTRQQT